MTSDFVECDLSDFLPEALRDKCEDCILQAPEAALRHIEISAPPVPGLRKKYRVIVSQPDFNGKLRVALGPGGGVIRVDTCGPMRSRSADMARVQHPYRQGHDHKQRADRLR